MPTNWWPAARCGRCRCAPPATGAAASTRWSCTTAIHGWASPRLPISRIVYDGHQPGDGHRCRLDRLEIEAGLANESFDTAVADHVGLQMGEQPPRARRHLDRRRDVDELRAVQVELRRAPPGDVERLDVRVVPPHADPCRLAGLVEQAAQPGEAVEQQQVVVGVARDAGDLGDAPGRILLQPHAAQRVGQHLDADAVAAPHHDRTPSVIGGRSVGAAEQDRASSCRRRSAGRARPPGATT